MIRSATSAGPRSPSADLPRRRAFVQETQNAAVRLELGGLGYRHPSAFSQGPLLLPADALATLPQEGQAWASESSLGCGRTGPQTGPGESRPQLLAGGRLGLHQRGDVEQSSREP